MRNVIYESKGKAGEYSKYACNFYVGCSCGCHYCYNKTGRFRATLGGDKPTLKKCFKDEKHALEVFEKELKQNLPELQKHGLFFSFTTDPMTQSTGAMTLAAVYLCGKNNVPVKILTKTTTYIEQFLCNIIDVNWENIAFGFTLTGRDDLEPNASPNAERIKAMKKLHDAGFKTWASIEPVITFASSFKMVRDSRHFCDLFKIGLESGKKYDKNVLQRFIDDVIEYTEYFGCKLYFKDGLLKQAGINRENLPPNCVKRDYKFKDK
ncbi:MAG: radical SAM protein [Tannerellaceae bacterium]|jgi:DNA repair photolyase|nr:radical SAM protein [Tannerellaceae bacterium]